MREYIPRCSFGLGASVPTAEVVLVAVGDMMAVVVVVRVVGGMASVWSVRLIEFLSEVEVELYGGLML